MPDEPFWKRLGRLRKSRGLTLRQIAEPLGVCISSVHNWESGEDRPYADKLPHLADILHCSVDYLLTGQESAYRAQPAEPPHAALHRAIYRR